MSHPAMPPPPTNTQRPLNTRDPVSLAGRDTNYRNTPISWKGPNHEKCIVDKVMVTSEWGTVFVGGGGMGGRIGGRG
jgi:hypothetical protein